MQEMGLAAIYSGPNLSRRSQEHSIYRYLLRNLNITRPNQVWGIDIPYIRLGRGWMYLVALNDWNSRFVVGWALYQYLEKTFVLQAVEEPLARARPEIMNSHQGSQFTSPEYINLLHSVGIKISMDSKDRAIDNIFTERLWRSLKYEEVYLNEYGSPREAWRGIACYLEFYNYRRLHQSLENKKPTEVYYHANDNAQIYIHIIAIIVKPKEVKPKYLCFLGLV